MIIFLLTLFDFRWHSAFALAGNFKFATISSNPSLSLSHFLTFSSDMDIRKNHSWYTLCCSFFAIDGSVLQNSKKETLFLTAFLTLQTPLQSPSTPKDGNLKIQIFPHTHPHSWVVLILEATQPTLDSISSFSVNFVFVCRCLAPCICHFICLFYLYYDFHDILPK